MPVNPAITRWDVAMGVALRVAVGCLDTADVPVGALLLAEDGTLLAQAGNAREATGDPTAHAEILALRAAAQAHKHRQPASGRAWDLSGCTLVVTLEPCVMCAGAALAARVDRLVFGAWDEKAGAVGSVWDLVRDGRGLHQIEVIGGVRAAQCAQLLREFFTRRR